MPFAILWDVLEVPFRNVTGWNWCACFGVRIENPSSCSAKLEGAVGTEPKERTDSNKPSLTKWIIRRRGYWSLREFKRKVSAGAGRIQEQIWVQKLFTEATSPSHPAVQADGELPANVLKKGWAGEEFCPEKLPYTLPPCFLQAQMEKFKEIPWLPEERQLSSSDLARRKRCLLLILKTEKRTYILYHA